VNVLEPPTRISGITPVMGPVPTLGQHTDTILEELGFDSQTIATWRKDGTIA
jgi:itaconate CoA-transferase